WPNLVLLIFLHVALSRSAYGLSGVFESVGPLFWVVFFIGFYFLLLRYFVVVARDMYSAMQIRRPANEWGLENRMLLRIHNSILFSRPHSFAGRRICIAEYISRATTTKYRSSRK